MPEHSIDDLVRAIETVELLRDAIREHAKALHLLHEKVARLESAIAEIRRVAGSKA